MSGVATVQGLSPDMSEVATVQGQSPDMAWRDRARMDAGGADT